MADNITETPLPTVEKQNFIPNRTGRGVIGDIPVTRTPTGPGEPRMNSDNTVIRNKK